MLLVTRASLLFNLYNSSVTTPTLGVVVFCVLRKEKGRWHNLASILAVRNSVYLYFYNDFFYSFMFVIKEKGTKSFGIVSFVYFLHMIY